MVIPPINESAEKYLNLNELNKSLALKSISTLADYVEAVKHGSTFVRIGSSISVHDLNFCATNSFIIFKRCSFFNAIHPSVFCNSF